MLTTKMWRNLIKLPECWRVDFTLPWQQFLADILYWTWDTARCREQRLENY